MYFDNAATSFPKPEPVYQRIDHVLRRVGGNPGRASHALAMEAARAVFNAREAVAELLAVPDSSRVVFTKNTTEAINLALKGVLRRGGHVITSAFEHNSIIKTLEAISRLTPGMEITRLKPNDEWIIDPRAVEAVIRKDTALVVITHASNVFGTIQPVSEIGASCRRQGVLFMIDAAQTAGAYPIDVKAMSVDLLATAGHKSLFGPQGTGVLYVAAGMEIDPLINGGTGELDIVLPMPERLESGTLNTPGIAGLGAGVRFILDEGIEKIRSHETTLIASITNGLAGIKGVRIIGPTDASKRASLVSFTINGVLADEVGRRLNDEFSIMLRTGTHCAFEAHKLCGTWPDGAIRVSPGYFNTVGEIERFLEAISTIARNAAGRSR
ncbi:MAG: aminotransferase class V-fold PLP-dependent enzyme [Deltaproteobacteria bacterium]|nr:aminotransferase class V-fold PLP-dependent enzyme [Deltaproteobacteria bacterium]